MKTEAINLARVGLAERNTLVLRRFDALAPGDVLELSLDAPPWVLYHQLRTDRFDQFDWEILEEHGDDFVVRLTRLR